MIYTDLNRTQLELNISDFWDDWLGIEMVIWSDGRLVKLKFGWKLNLDFSLFGVLTIFGSLFDWNQGEISPYRRQNSREMISTKWHSNKWHPAKGSAFFKKTSKATKISFQIPLKIKILLQMTRVFDMLWVLIIHIELNMKFSCIWIAKLLISEQSTQEYKRQWI